MLTIKQLIAAFNIGDTEGVYSELRRYGTIAGDNSWEETDTSAPGMYRAMLIDYLGYRWEVLVRNGEVRDLGYKAL